MADMGKKNVLTYAGLQALEAELNNLKSVRRKEIAQKIKEAREQGDLSENAEYDAAKEEQRDVEARIVEIEQLLKNVEIITESDVDDTKINVGCNVKLYDLVENEAVEFSIVGSSQTNSLANRISNESPVGSALIGHEVGDVVEFMLGDEKISYRVESISKMKDEN